MNSFKENLYTIVFETDTEAGKNFDLTLIISIFISVIIVLLDSVGEIKEGYGSFLLILEWLFTLAFTAEYIVRLWIVRKPFAYAISFFGIVDLLSIVPSYLSIFVTGAQILIVIRVLRLLRLFRVLKLIRYVEEANILITALLASQRKITVFLATVLSITIIIGSVMYIIEGPKNGFVSIPRGMYWSIVTLTTVGYGDFTPQTSLGKFFASVLMILGYSILAVPTGVFSAELSRATIKNSDRTCFNCHTYGHEKQAKFCKDCGKKL